MMMGKIAMAGKYFSNENDLLASSITLLRYFSNIFETFVL